MSAENWMRRASGLVVPAMSFADHPLGKFQPCPGECCPEPPPECCMQVAFSLTAGCIGGTYNLEQTIPGARWECVAYNYCFSSNPQTITAELTESGGTWYMTITVDGHTWKKSYDSEPTPCDFSGEDIPHDSSGACDSSGSTCTLTADSDLTNCPDCGLAECEDIFKSCIGAGGGIEQVSVDLGAGGWIDGSSCGGCDEVKGVYILPWTGCLRWFGAFGSHCVCPIGPHNACLGVDVRRKFDGGVWKFQIEVRLGYKASPLECDGYTSAQYAQSIYYSPPIPGCDVCFPPGGLTFTRQGLDYHGLCGLRELCSGNLPNTAIVADAT